MVAKPALASRLTRRVNLQQPVSTADGIGGFTISWQNFATVWAEITPKSGSVSVSDERVIGVKKITVVIRYIKNVTNAMRIQHGARFYQIVTILNPYEENVMLEIFAEETN